VISWLPVVAVVVGSVLLERAGDTGVSWAVDVLAVAACWLTRVLRRRPHAAGGCR
jgi:hypothetical protein